LTESEKNNGELAPNWLVYTQKHRLFLPLGASDGLVRGVRQQGASTLDREGFLIPFAICENPSLSLSFDPAHYSHQSSKLYLNPFSSSQKMWMN
jgi:hypothetical protein